MSAWPTRRLGDLTDLLSGFAFDSEQFSDSEGMPLVRIRDVLPGKSFTYFSGSYDPRYLINDGEILIGMDGEFNRARWRGGKSLLNQRVLRIASASRDLDESYLFHFLPSALKAIEDVTPFVTVKHLSVKHIREIAIPLPPLTEQRRIAEILDKTDLLRAKRREALAQLDAISQSIFLDMFGDPVRNEKGWPCRSLSELAIFENGDRSSNYPSGDEIKDEGILFLSTKNIVDDKLDLKTTSYISHDKFASLSRGKAQRGDLIITLRGTLASCCIFESSHETAFINAQMMIIRPRETLISHYLHALLTSQPAKHRFAELGRGAAVPQLTAAQLSRLPIPVAPVDLQRLFLRRVSAIDRLETIQTHSQAELDALFASLQHRAFQGAV